jgi:hypothetical protein
MTYNLTKNKNLFYIQIVLVCLKGNLCIKLMNFQVQELIIQMIERLKEFKYFFLTRYKPKSGQWPQN